MVEFCAWVYEFEEQQFRRWLKGDYPNRSYRTYGSSDSNVGEGSDLQYDDGTDTVYGWTLYLLLINSC